MEVYARETSGSASQRVEMEVDRTYNKERESFQLELHEDKVEGEAREGSAGERQRKEFWREVQAAPEKTVRCRCFLEVRNALKETCLNQLIIFLRNYCRLQVLNYFRLSNSWVRSQKLQKAVISLIISVPQSARKNSAPTKRILIKFNT